MKWNGTLSWMDRQYSHFSCQPTPSKLTTMNCGGFWPGLSLVGVKPSGRVPGPPLPEVFVVEPVVPDAPVDPDVDVVLPAPPEELDDPDDDDDDDDPDDEAADDPADEDPDDPEPVDPAVPGTVTFTVDVTTAPESPPPQAVASSTDVRTAPAAAVRVLVRLRIVVDRVLACTIVSSFVPRRRRAHAVPTARVGSRPVPRRSRRPRTVPRNARPGDGARWTGRPAGRPGCRPLTRNPPRADDQCGPPVIGSR
ncbi:hypothetical protein GCM10011594_33390 [Nakamurella endophytica]|uniref:Uncharacterized protein n=1 Tax=Nakamurella endophytica TaxID=1748367 RepID=A0A917WKK6_9ACTN|nr:hypothetical protein GCM10011594_33390 [Nakamurella endophytica]